MLDLVKHLSKCSGMPRSYQDCRQYIVRGTSVDVVPREDLVFEMHAAWPVYYNGIRARGLVCHLRKIPANCISKSFVPTVVEEVNVVGPIRLGGQFPD